VQKERRGELGVLGSQIPSGCHLPLLCVDVYSHSTSRTRKDSGRFSNLRNCLRVDETRYGPSVFVCCPTGVVLSWKTEQASLNHLSSLFFSSLSTTEIQGGHPRILFRFENEIHKDFLLFLRILHFPASQRNRQLALFPELSSLLTHRAQQREGERSSVSEGRTITRKQESKRSVLGELAIWCSFAVPHLSTLVAWQKRDGTQNTPTRLYHPIGKGIFSHDELCTFLRSWMERDELDSLCQEGQSSVDPIAFSTISSSRQEWTRRQRVPPPLSPDLSNCSFDPPRSAFSRSLPGPKNSYPRGGQNLASQQRSSSSSSSLCMRGRMTFSDSDDASVGGRWQRQNESISQPSETVPHEWIRDLAKEILTWMSTSPPRRCNLFFWMTSHLSLSLTALLRYAFFYLFDADHSDKETMKTALYILFHATRAVDPDIQEILEQQDLPSPFAYPHFESWWKRARSFCCTRPTEERRESVPEPQ